MASITLAGIAKRFGEVQALAPLDLEIGQGQFVGVLGPSGCGKTTLLRCLAGLEQPDAGMIRFGERAVVDVADGLLLPPQRRGLGMVFQDLALWPHLTVFENVAYTLRARKDTRDLADRVHDALAKVQLSDHGGRYPHQLSGGQQQRVSFARAIVDRPPVLLMDEPLSALDAALRVDLRAELTALTRELGLTTVYVTHDQHEALSMADRILVMQDGEVRQDGAPEDVYGRPTTRFVADFIGRLNTFDRPLRPRPAPTLTPAPAGGAGMSDVPAAADLAAATSPLAEPATELVTAARADGALERLDARIEVAVSGAGVAGIRPEKVTLTPGERASVALPAVVELVSFLGDRYELRCRHEHSDRPWVVPSTHRVEVGTSVLIHLDPDDLIVTDR